MTDVSKCPENSIERYTTKVNVNMYMNQYVPVYVLSLLLSSKLCSKYMLVSLILTVSMVCWVVLLGAHSAFTPQTALQPWNVT